jgi:hypothetical protein
MRKSFALLLVLILTVPSPIAVKLARASIPKPSVPEFTVKFVNASYSVTTTNPYTGLSETKLTSNNSIEVTIKNQPIGYPNYQIYFNVRIKPHFEGDWREIYPIENRTSSYNGDGTFSFALYIFRDSPTQSSSSYTIITFPVVPTELYSATGYDIQRYYSGTEGQEGRYFAFLSAIPAGGQVDFQVEALIGHASSMWVIDHPLAPTIGGHFSPAVAYDTTSDWSSTQTLTIGTSSPDEENPTLPPTEPPPSQQHGFLGTSLPVEYGYAIVAIIAMGAVAFLVYFRKIRKTTGKVA